MVSFSRLRQQGLTRSCVDQERHNIIPQGFRCTLCYDWSRYLQYHNVNINAVLTFALFFFHCCFGISLSSLNVHANELVFSKASSFF